MAKRPEFDLNLDEVTKSDDILVTRGRSSIPPEEKPVTEQVREFLAQAEETDEFHEYRRSTPPPPPVTTPFADIVKRAYGTGQS